MSRYLMIGLFASTLCASLSLPAVAESRREREAFEAGRSLGQNEGADRAYRAGRDDGEHAEFRRQQQWREQRRQEHEYQRQLEERQRWEAERGKTFRFGW